MEPEMPEMENAGWLGLVGVTSLQAEYWIPGNMGIMNCVGG